jgi:hypothetical protein
MLAAGNAARSIYNHDFRMVLLLQDQFSKSGNYNSIEPNVTGPLSTEEVQRQFHDVTQNRHTSGSNEDFTII